MSAAEMADPIEVPYDELRPDTLRAVVEEFVTRDTTDYGEREVSLESKVADVMQQLRRGEAKVLFDPDTETVNIWRAPPRPAGKSYKRL